MIGRKETGGSERRGKATGSKATAGKEQGTKASGMRATGAQDSQETGEGDVLVGEKEIDNMLPDDTTAEQNTGEGIRYVERDPTQELH